VDDIARRSTPRPIRTRAWSPSEDDGDLCEVGELAPCPSCGGVRTALTDCSECGGVGFLVVAR
jgi:hypothetical protein